MESSASAAHTEVRGSGYPDFEALLSRPHDLGFYPTNKLVGDVAHAAHGLDLAAAA
jgi:hypothetical protein